MPHHFERSVSSRTPLNATPTFFAGPMTASTRHVAECLFPSSMHPPVALLSKFSFDRWLLLPVETMPSFQATGLTPLVHDVGIAPSVALPRIHSFA